MRLCEETKIVPILEPEDHNAGVDGDSVSMENYAHATFILLFGELTGDAVLKFFEGATAGAKTSALTFSYRATSTDLKNAGGDTLGAEGTSAALTLTAATYEDRMIVVEIDDSALDQSNAYKFITPEVSSAASEEFASIVAVLSRPRFAEDVPPTAIS
jgi:hypothetical protein